MTFAFKSTLGRLVKAVYDWLPLQDRSRRRIKHWLFTSFPVIFSSTNAYARWRTFGTQPYLTNPGGSRDERQVVKCELTAAEIHTHDIHSALLRQMQAQSRSVAEQPEHVTTREDMLPVTDARAKVIAFYLPQFHPITENDSWWGAGFTEWTNVGKAFPQFVGHYQPRLPGELGYYDLRVPQVMQRQVELARRYGVHGFCFHYYWFGGRRLLELPLNQFVQSDIKFPFCVCWANENWTRRWDGQDQDILIGQDHSEENDNEFIHDLVELLRDPRYIRIDGKPLVIVYRPSLLPDAKATAERWRQYCRDHGVGEIVLGMVQFDVDDPRVYGFDVAIEFPPHKLARGLPHCHDQLEFLGDQYRGYVVSYDDVVRNAMEWPHPDYALFRGVFPSWDNEARKPGAGYTFAGSTPAKYQRWLEDAVSYAEQSPVDGERVVFVNAWNEWAEGAYLEPDRKFGYGYLQATRDVVDKSGSAEGGSPESAMRIAVVSHDAHPHGAQYLALNLAKEILALGIDVEAVLLGEGVLLEQFEAVATVHHAKRDREALDELARKLVALGVSKAIVNTAVGGDCVAALADAGIQCVSLVHELPGVIRQYSLASAVAQIADKAERVVFAASEVLDGFRQFAPLPASRATILPQGLYKRNQLVNSASQEQARRALRSRLGMPADAQVVLCVGYADARKGVDLFIEIGSKVMSRNSRAHFVWVGHPDLEIQRQIASAIEVSGCSDRFHMVGRHENTDEFYAGADIYALTSREDPYPSVIMEAFDAAVPVIGFRGAGGFESLLEQTGGALADPLDTEKFSRLCLELLGDDGRRQALGSDGRRFVERERCFRHYVFDLLKMLGIKLPRVSVVIPNYNYARYLPERIASVLEQSVPIYEIIVLDDASTDDSLAVIDRLRAGSAVPIRVDASTTNSGSVFRQWLRGLRLAKGDYVWIAEADDLAEPALLDTLLPPLRNGQAVMSYAQSRQIDDAGKEIARNYLDYVDAFGRARWQAPFVADLSEELQHGLAVKNTIPNVSAVLFKRAALVEVLERDIDEVAGYRIAGDWLLYLRLLELGSLAFSPKPLNAHRRHASSVTIGSDQSPHLEEILRVQEGVRRRHAPGAAVNAAANEYAEFLYRYFSLDGGGSRSIHHDDRFAPLLPSEARLKHAEDSKLARSVAVVAEAWEDSGYYEHAEQYTRLFWDGEQNPFRTMFDKLDLSYAVELACGRGRHAERAAPLAGRLVLIDIHPQNLSVCRKRLAQFSNLEYLLTGGSDLRPLRDDSLSALYCYDAMVHFSPDIVEAYLAEIMRVLTPGGMALLHHSNYPHEHEIHYGGNPHSRNNLSLARMEAMAGEAGLKVVESTTMAWGGIPDLDGLTLLRKPQ